MCEWERREERDQSDHQMKCKNARMNSKQERAPKAGLIEFRSPLRVGLAAAVIRKFRDREKGGNGEEKEEANRKDGKREQVREGPKEWITNIREGTGERDSSSGQTN